MPHRPSAVIDTTVLVSAAIAIDADRWSAPRLLIEEALIRRESFEHFTSAPILYEVGDVLSRARIQFRPENITDYIALLARASSLVQSVQGIVMGCRDPRDDNVLECAMNGPAGWIVTRDLDLLEASPHEKYAITKTGPGIRDVPITVVSVEVFLADVLGFERARTGSRRSRR
jgi:putative PIN family toxin of toxin-antitoxin system